MKYIYTATFVLLLGMSVHAQNFGLDPDTVVANKPADFFTFYLPAQFSNSSGQDLQLRWVKEILLEEYEGSHGGDGLWDYSIQDPINFYSDGKLIDSADFVLQAVPAAFDKFIVQVYPNMTVGQMIFAFNIYEIGNPSNNIGIVFDYTATTPGTSPTYELEDTPLPRIFPNPANDRITIDNNTKTPWNISLLSSDGRNIKNPTESLDSQSSLEMEVTDIPSGIYFLRITNEEQIFIKKLTIQ